FILVDNQKSSWCDLEPKVTLVQNGIESSQNRGLMQLQGYRLIPIEKGYINAVGESQISLVSNVLQGFLHLNTVQMKVDHLVQSRPVFLVNIFWSIIKQGTTLSYGCSEKFSGCNLQA